MLSTVVGVDLAKKVFQVCVYANNKVRSNNEMTPSEFTVWLANTHKSTIIFEACSTSNYWKQKVEEFGHEGLLISAKLVSAVRQNQKQIKMMHWLLFNLLCYPKSLLLQVNPHYSNNCKLLSVFVS